MEIKKSLYKIKGMSNDLSYSAFNPEYSWENHNIRITARDSNNLFGITNEKGNISLSFNESTPIKTIKYSYSNIFYGYIPEQIITTYTYSNFFNRYIPEQSENPVPNSYTYISEFIDYVQELQLI